MVHLVRVSAIEGRKGEMLDLIDRALRVSPEGDQVLALRALQAFSAGDRSAIQQVLQQLQHARAVTVGIAFSDVALYSGDLAGAENLARSFIQAARSPELRALCHILVAHLALAQGRTDVAWEELGVAESLDATWGLEVRALVATLPFLVVPDQELREIRGALAGWDPTDVAPSMFLIFAMHNDLHPAIRAYLLGLLDLRLNDVASAKSQVEALAVWGTTRGGLVESLVVELRAAIA